jgi:hypothetical protein
VSQEPLDAVNMENEEVRLGHGKKKHEKKEKEI